MKPRFSLKFLLIATACCILATLAEVLKGKLLPVNIVNHQDIKAVFFWIILLIGWAVYFLDLYRMRRKKHEDDKEAG